MPPDSSQVPWMFVQDRHCFKVNNFHRRPGDHKVLFIIPDVRYSNNPIEYHRLCIRQIQKVKILNIHVTGPPPYGVLVQNFRKVRPVRVIKQFINLTFYRNRSWQLLFIRKK
jgi:hypothetical protein